MPTPRLPICRFPGCHRPAQADRKGRRRFCSYVHFHVYRTACAVAQSQSPPRGRDHARDAAEAMRLMDMAVDVGPGELLSRDDFRAVDELADAYRSARVRESNARPR